jgi:predicted Zn-dependent protease
VPESRPSKEAPAVDSHGSLIKNAELRGSGGTLAAVAACEALLESGDLAAARQQLESLGSVTPASECEWNRLHSLCLRLKDHTRGQLFTERFLGVCNDSALAHLANAQSFGSVNRNRDRILASIAAALKNPRSDSGFWYEVAKIQKNVNEHDAACDSARTSISLDPMNVEARELLIASLGVLKRRSEIRSECVLLARCLTQSNDKEPSRWARLARLAAEALAMKQAKSYIDIAAGYLSSSSYGAEVDLILALIMTRQPRRAMKHLQHLLEANSKNTWLWTALIESAMSRRYYDIALVAITQLKAIPFQDPEFLYRMSLTEKTARSGGFLKRIVLDWIRFRGW